MITLATVGGPADAELWGRLWRIDAALQLGDIDVVDTELGHLGTLAEGLGWPIAHWHRHRLTAARLLLAGRFAEAEAAADRADTEARRIEDITALRVGGAFRLDLLRLQGRFGETLAILRAARPALASAPPVFLAAAGLAVAQAGQADEARRMLDQVRPALPRQPRDGRWICIVAVAGQLAALLDATPTVAWCLDQITPHSNYYLAAGSGSISCEGAVARITGTLAAALDRPDEARQWLATAIAMDERIGALPYLVLAEIELARVLAARQTNAKQPPLWHTGPPTPHDDSVWHPHYYRTPTHCRPDCGPSETLTTHYPPANAKCWPTSPQDGPTAKSRPNWCYPNAPSRPTSRTSWPNSASPTGPKPQYGQHATASERRRSRCRNSAQPC
jgi:hypothetical protein